MKQDKHRGYFDALRAQAVGTAPSVALQQTVGAELPHVVAQLGQRIRFGRDRKRELTRRRQTIPIVFITAHRDDSVRSRLLEQGAVECLFKPFHETALLEALNAALRVS